MSVALVATRPRGRCVRCREKPRLEKMKFCSDECAKVYIHSCAFCRIANVEGKGRFCTKRCREKHLERAATPRYLRGTCPDFLNDDCPWNDRCWLNHPTLNRIPGDIVLQHSQSHTTRLRRYLLRQEFRSFDLRETRTIRAKRGRSKTADMESLMFLFVNRESCLDDEAHSRKCQSLMRRLMEDPILRNTLRRCYAFREQKEAFLSESELLRRARALLNGRSVFDVFAYPKELETRLSNELRCSESTRDDAQVAIFALRDENTYYLGVETFRRDDVDRDVAYLRRVSSPRPPMAVSRAYYKLRQVIIGTPFLEWAKASAGTCAVRAMDVGAAPGGWSYQLAGSCGVVYAVDPGAMSEPIPPKVKHIRQKIETCLAEGLIPRESVHAYVCDMNASPTVVLRIFECALPLLAPNAVVCLTLKSFFGKIRSKESGKSGDAKRVKRQENRECDDKDEACLDKLRYLMREACVRIRTRVGEAHAAPGSVRLIHLMSNGRDERTIIFRMRGRKSSESAV